MAEQARSAADPDCELEHVFVYGTLKRGQCREAGWPTSPQQIRDAWTRGRLIDLGPYPALLEGADRIWGELWSFDAREIEVVHATLDQIEVYNQPGLIDEYHRVRVSVQTLQGDRLLASTYRFADANRAKQFQAVPPSRRIDGYRYVVWPAELEF